MTLIYLARKSVMRQNTRNRDLYLDSAAGLLLLYMIVYHCAQWAGFGDVFVSKTIVLSFFMPWFFFKAGMMAHPPLKTIDTASSLTPLVKKSFRRLIVPWLIWSAVGTVFYFVILYATSGVIDAVTIRRYAMSPLLRGTVVGNMPLWFLFGLFAVRIIFAAVLMLRHSWIIITAISAISFLMYYVVAQHLSTVAMLHVPNYIAYVSSGLMFYALGYLLRDFRPNTILLIAITAVYLVAVMVWPAYVFMYENTVMTGGYAIAQIYALMGIVCINGWMLRIADSRNILSRIGSDTLTPYCLHWIVIEITAAVLAPSLSHVTMFLILCAVNALALPLLTIAITKYREIY